MEIRRCDEIRCLTSMLSKICPYIFLNQRGSESVLAAYMYI